MDLTLALTLFVLALMLWAMLPAPIRAGLRGGFGPAVHALAEAVRWAWREGSWALGGVMCKLFGIERVNRLGSAPRPVLSTLDDDEDYDLPVQPAPAPIGAAGATAVQSHRTPSTDGAASAPGAALSLSPEELQAVQRMLYAYQRAQAFGKALSKTDAIKAGFGVGRSGSNPRYLRASQIYDALLGEPEPAVKYPELTAQRQH